MVIKIDYKKCCWKPSKMDNFRGTKNSKNFSADGKCTSCDCGESCSTACVGCVEACPVQALTRKDKVVVDKKKCLSCGSCISACKHGALSLEE